MTGNIMTIKIYKVNVLEAMMMAECGEHYSLTPFKESLRYKGYDDGGKDYDLRVLRFNR